MAELPKTIVLYKEWLCTACGETYEYRKGVRRPANCQKCGGTGKVKREGR